MRQGIDETLPYVALVLVTYNCKQYIEALIDDLSRTVYDSNKIILIIIDNASTDGTYGCVARRLGKTRFYKQILHRNKQNLGFAPAVNVALSLIIKYFPQVKYVVILNPDMRLLDNKWLIELISLAKYLKKVAIIGTWTLGGYGERFDSIGGMLDPMFFPAEEFPLSYNRGISVLTNVLKLNHDYQAYTLGVYQTLKRQRFSIRPYTMPYIAFHCVLLNLDYVRELGLLKSDFVMYFEDVEYSLRAWSSGFATVIYPKPLIWHARGFSRMTHKSKGFSRLKENSKRKFSIMKSQKYPIITIYYYIRNSIRICCLYSNPLRMLMKIVFYLLYSIIDKYKRSYIHQAIARYFLERTFLRDLKNRKIIPRGIIPSQSSLKSYYVFWLLKYLINQGNIGQGFKYASVKTIMNYLISKYKVRNC